MKIRRYMGKNAQEAILKVKMDLGNDAIILNTRKVRRKGIKNIFSKPMVEVLAAIDEYNSVRKDTVKENKELERAANEVSEEKFEKLESKITNMEALLSKIYNNPNGNVDVSQEKSSSEKVLELFYNNLLKNEVEDKLAKEIIHIVKDKLGEKNSVNEAALCFYSVISNMLGKPEALKLKENSNGPTIVAFIGPTGAGKTTTLAKIAANYTLEKKKSVALIAADTYRIAAVEQLKTYAEILGLPISVVYSTEDIDETIKMYQDKDIILIDTAGRNHKNASQFGELKNLINYLKADEVYLVISTTISISNCREILSNYNFIDNYKLIFTKADEASTTGIILNLKYFTKKSLSYVTTGQNVPDDIELANIEKITKSLIGSLS